MERLVGLTVTDETICKQVMPILQAVKQDMAWMCLYIERLQRDFSRRTGMRNVTECS